MVIVITYIHVTNRYIQNHHKQQNWLDSNLNSINSHPYHQNWIVKGTTSYSAWEMFCWVSTMGFSWAVIQGIFLWFFTGARKGLKMLILDRLGVLCQVGSIT